MRFLTGDSIGHWENDTLVVDTTNFSKERAFRGASSNMHLVEKFTRVDGDTLRYEFTVDDPATWTQKLDGVGSDDAFHRADLRIRVPRGQLRARRRAQGRAVSGKAAATQSEVGGMITSRNSVMVNSRFLIGVLLTIGAVAAVRAQITSNPIPAPIVKRGLAVEIKDLVRLPDTRGIRPADQDVSPVRVGACQLRARSSRRPPLRQRFARLPLPDRLEQPAAGLRERRRGISERGLQPAGERIHRVRLSSGVRAKRPVLHRARRARPGQSEDARLHPARVRARKT